MMLTNATYAIARFSVAPSLGTSVAGARPRTLRIAALGTATRT
ncbi:hypothetical protein [Georgenia muralis]